MYLFALITTLVITSCGHKKGEDPPLIRPVKTATVSSQSVIHKDFSGMVEAVEYVKLAFRVSGQIINPVSYTHLDVYKRQTCTSVETYPTKEMTSIAPLGACSEKLPSMSVMTPFVVPFCSTLAPIMGSPIASFTLPSVSYTHLKFVSRHLNGNHPPLYQSIL